MSSSFQIRRTLVKKSSAMSSKRVSKDTVDQEWQEIRAAQKSAADFRPLYERYHEGIYLFIYKRTMKEQLSADLTAQVFLKALENIGSYTFKGVPFSAWLFRIASNEVAQHYRMVKKQRVVSIDTNGVNLIAAEMEEIDSADYRAALVHVLNELKPEDLQLIELRFFEQMSFKEIATVLNITESNAKVRRHRIVERMKKKMENFTNQSSHN